jgi:Protein of unknown function (DUF3040)
MCLSAREQRLLDGIDERTRRSDPRLASMLTIFTRLTADETMPDRERISTLAGRTRSALHGAAAAITGLRARAASHGGRASSPELAKETTMHPSPLPPDPTSWATGSPLPPDPALLGRSPLPPGPARPVVTRPRPGATGR